MPFIILCYSNVPYMLNNVYLQFCTHMYHPQRYMCDVGLLKMGVSFFLDDLAKLPFICCTFLHIFQDPWPPAKLYI